MKYVIVSVAALTLAACTPTQEEQNASMEQVRSKLPEGCALTYLGEVDVVGYQKESRVFVVKCENTTTVSSANEYAVGKNTYTSSEVSFSQN